MRTSFLQSDCQVATGDLFGTGGNLVHGADQHVEVVLDVVEVAIVVLCNCRRDIAFGDQIDVASRYVEWPDDRVEQRIHAAHNVSVSTFNFFRMAALSELSGFC